MADNKRTLAGDKATDTAWPTEIRAKRTDRVLEVDFDDGETITLTAELLRVESPSAEVQGHGADEKRIVAGKEAVGISRIEPVGNYAVRLVFDDGHDTGIYSWRYLRKLGRDKDQLWAGYLAALEERGLSRAPAA